MPELTKKLDRFTATILAEATAETERTLAALGERRQAAHVAAEDRILLETYNYIHSEVTRIKHENGRSISRHMLENKRALFLRRSEISNEVFALVREKLVAFTATPDYRRRLETLFREAMTVLAGAHDIRVRLRPEDMPQATALSALMPSVTFEEGDFFLGGLIADSTALGLRLDSTFDSAIAALDGHFAELFGISLSDE